MLARSSSSAALGAVKPCKVLPTRAEDYELLEEIGQGVSAKVWRANCKPLEEVVAIKILDLERQDPGKLEEIRKEAHTMSLLNHPHLVSCYCSFVSGPNLWVIMPYFAGGSVLNIMKWGHPQGLDESVIATIMEPVLRALSYFHRNGNIHRDIKAGNILIDDHGNVKLADYGVATSGFDSFGLNAHQTFVGTPCWMAPEVMEQSNGYDQQADIWSLGITLLELAHGHAPFAKFPPMKVLMMTLQNPPPTLEADSGTHHFSRHLRDLVAQCLQKDPKKRPSAKALLEHRFFSEKTKKPDFLVKTLLEGIPPLGERVRILRERENARRGAAVENDIKSQTEYVRGVSNWNFNIEDIKAEAGGSDSKDSPRSSLGGASSAEGKVQHKGRFDVYDSDSTATSTISAATESTVVRKGRFEVVANVATSAELEAKLGDASIHDKPQ